jgi:sulfur carrier protein ThiS adenylyltransferase
MGKQELGQELFCRNVPGMTAQLQKYTVGIAGCGGTGSNVAVALTRAGIGELILVDGDLVELSNLNRQYFFQSDVGKSKAYALAAHLKNINPDIRLDIHNQMIESSQVAQLFSKANLLIEAFDIAQSKKFLLNAWCRAFPNRPVVSGNGLSGVGKTAECVIRQMGQIWFCGDGTSNMMEGLCAPRVALVANMQANLAIELLLEE